MLQLPPAPGAFGLFAAGHRKVVGTIGDRMI